MPAVSILRGPMNHVQALEFYPFDADQIEDTLGLTPPPFVDVDEALKQLRYILRFAGSIGCKSAVVECHYIDRDHIEDHSVFYSKDLHPHPNWCRRIHFFKIDAEGVKQKLTDLLRIGSVNGQREHQVACRTFSEDAYLGFSVVKPLAGSPIGRTVLRPLEGDSDGSEFIRSYECTRLYRAHLAGNELTVRGLAFQQQDLGVSACATTAIWASMHKARDFEEIGSTTPSQITALASRYALPFGRAMPSEGLSIDQMCQAIQAIGVSPNIYRTTDFGVCRAYLHTACRSGIASILILRDEVQGWHAVTVAGMKTRSTHQHVAVTPELPDTGELASDLVALYVHDDRLGPYLRADLLDRPTGPTLTIERPGMSPEHWSLRHIIAPIHGKVRMSFADLGRIAQEIVSTAHAWREHYSSGANVPPDPTITVGNWIVRATRYARDLLEVVSPGCIERLYSTVSLPRYLAIVHLESPYFGAVNVLIDTTGTLRSARCLAVLPFDKTLRETAISLSRYLSEDFNCPLIMDQG